jgi:membrane-associated phospholipid phosphatase
MKFTFENIVSSSVIGVYIIPILLFIFTHKFIHLKALLGVISTAYIGESIKYYIIKYKSPRPIGACDCNLMTNDGIQEGKPGMPSGHSSTITFFTTFYFQQTKNPKVKIILIIYALSVMISRYKKKCHTIHQIITGSLLGLIMGILVVWYL